MSDGQTPLASPGRRFDGTIALITGAGTGIGAAPARGLAAGGGRAVLLGPDRKALEEVATETGGGEGSGALMTCTTGKTALLGSVRSVAVEYEPQGVRAHVVRHRRGGRAGRQRGGRRGPAQRRHPVDLMG